MENLLQKHAREALSTCPEATWVAEPVADYANQRLSLENMQAQLEDQAIRARNSVVIMLVGWALNGKWPRTRNAPVYFTRQVLFWASSKDWFLRPGDLPEKSPPWTVKEISKFLDLTVKPWYRNEMKGWAEYSARQHFELQQSYLSGFDD